MRLNLKIYQILPFLGILLLLGSNTQAIELTTKTKQIIQADLKFIVNEQLHLKTYTGQRVKFHLQALDTSSQQIIKNLIAKRGGSTKSYSWMKGDSKSFQQPWPKMVRGNARPTIKRITEKWDVNHYVYESQNYEFITNAKLSSKLILKCATLFEATFTMNSKLPLNLPGVHRTKDRKFRIYLHETRADYAKAGGPNHSSGVYMPSTEAIHVPLASLGVQRQGTSYVERGELNYQTLSHEITHQMMEGVLKSSWYTEGSAEYVAYTPYTYPATFQPGSSIKPYHKGITSVLGRNIQFPRLRDFMNLPYQQFSRGGSANYSRALILTYFFYRLDGDGSAIKNYLRILQSGAPESEAQVKLLNGRTYEKLEQELVKAWSRHGITLKFPDK